MIEMKTYPYSLIFRSTEGWWEDEVYIYETEQEAVNHMELFRDDDSGLYTMIQVMKDGVILHEITF